MRVDGQRHAPANLSREWPGIHCIEGWVGPGDRQHRSESLYRLSYPGHIRYLKLDTHTHTYTLTLLLQLEDGTEGQETKQAVVMDTWRYATTLPVNVAFCARAPN